MMKLEFTQCNSAQQHTGSLVVCWYGNEKIVYAGDGHRVMLWTVSNGVDLVVAELSDTLYPTCIHCFCRVSDSSAFADATDAFLLGSTEGKFYVIAKNGRIDKAVNAHDAAVSHIQYSSDGTSILSSSEDGSVKIWSKNGILRTVLCRRAYPVYSACWSPGNRAVVHCAGKELSIVPLRANEAELQWVAHEGAILSVDWNQSNDLILSGGEDCKYKVWDSHGKIMFSSKMLQHPVTAVAWSPDGQLFLIGSFNTLHFCDKSGWMHSVHSMLPTATVSSLSWSSSGTQVAIGFSGEAPVCGNVIQRSLESKQFQVTQESATFVNVHNVEDDLNDRLEFKDRIINFALGWQHLVVVTTRQCQIFRVFIICSEKEFSIYSYDGAKICKGRVPRSEPAELADIALSNDTLVFRETNLGQSLAVIDVRSGKLLDDARLQHSYSIRKMTLDQFGPPAERSLAFLDIHENVYLSVIRAVHQPQPMTKIGSLVHDLMFSEENNVLVGLKNGALVIWCCPKIAFIEKDIAPLGIIEKYDSSLGKSHEFLGFTTCYIAVRSADGAKLYYAVPANLRLLYEFCTKVQWSSAVKICRQAAVDHMWATLACLALKSRNFSVAEIAYTALNQVTKVRFIKKCRFVTDAVDKAAQEMLLSGNVSGAEELYLHNKYVLQAIMLNVLFQRWDHALDLAIRQKKYQDVVLGFRQQYLEDNEYKENKTKFLDISDEFAIHWESIEETVKSISI